MGGVDSRGAPPANPTAELRSRGADWRSIVVAALAGGSVFLIIDILGRALAAPATTWTTLRHIASLLIGERALRSEGAFDAGLLVLALVLHAMLSLVYGMLLVLAVRRLRIFPAIALGVVFSCLLYVVNYYVMTRLFTSFVDLRGMLALAAHLGFGFTTVLVHAALHRRPLQAAEDFRAALRSRAAGGEPPRDPRPAAMIRTRKEKLQGGGRRGGERKRRS